MTVFDEFDMEDKRIKSIKDLGAYTPGLMFFNAQNGASFSPTVRGMMTAYGSTSSSMGLYIDGVPMVGGNDAVFMDIERIEVLKGPQGTLYGKGAEAGVINIITKKPDNEVRGKVRTEFGSDNKREYSFGVSGPIIKDKLYIGLSGKHYEKDGLIENTYKGGQTDDREYHYGKINLRFTPTDSLDISLISQMLKRDDGGPSWNSYGAPSRENSSDVGDVDSTTHLNALRVEYNYGDYKFESISTYKRLRNKILRDFDFTSAATMQSLTDSKTEDVSQEFRLSAQHDRFNWLVGANVEKSELESYGNDSERTTDSYGVFAHAEYHLTKKLSLLAGLRYDDNSVDYKQPGKYDLSYESSEISPKIGLEYNLTKNSMIYTTISKGYRPGSIHVYSETNYEEETLWSYEVGSKNSLLDNKLILNAAVYYMLVDDMQVDSYPAGSTRVVTTNAAEATSKGLELELNYKATPSLTLFTSFSYNNTEYDEYNDGRADYSGNTTPFAPTYNYNIGAQYRAAKGYYARVDINGYGDMYLDRENKYERDAYNLVNGKVGYEHKNFDIYLYADNLFDKEYDYEGAFGNYVIYSDSREVGVQLTYRF